MTEYQALLDLVFSACFGWTIKLGKFWSSLLGQKLTVDKASPGGGLLVGSGFMNPS